MTERKFPILGATVPPMLGRASIMNRMVAALTKPVPSHLQVVGPRFAGKTVILHELAGRLRNAGKPYTAVLLWDLGHQTPATDVEFMQRLANELAVVMKKNHGNYVGLLESVSEGAYQDIAEVLDLLKEDGGKVLAILDGFDKPLSNGQLTRNLWDNLRELALKPSLRLVTASRRTLRELIRHPDTQGSDLWGIFDLVPVRVGCFDEDDLTTVLATMPAQPLAAGAKTELWNASNGFPVLALSVLNALGEEGEVGAEAMKASCDKAYPALRDILADLWRDCSPSGQDLLRRVLEEASVTRAGIAATDAEMLIERGFVHSVGNKLQRPSRLLGRYLEEQPHEGNALLRLFGTADAYQKNLKAVLERRISQIGGINPTLKRYLERGAEDLPDHPKIFLSSVQGILEQALAQIWKAECWNDVAGKPKIPTEWFLIWERNQEREKKIEDWKSRFPEGGARLRLLDLMTGTQNTDRLARFVTKNTYVLANAVQGFRDYGVHPKAAEIDVGTAYAALHVCIELAAALSRELPDAQGQQAGH
jgi:hypothetical protein